VHLKPMKGRCIMQILKNRSSLGVGVILITTLAASAHGPGAGKMMPMYDPATETRIKGSIDEVKQATCGQMRGTHVVLKSGDEATEVILGPSTYITSKGFSFVKGDSLDVTGSKMTMHGVAYIIAREVVKNGKSLTLRDKGGKPQWSGKGMGMVPCPAAN
jgi:hypothetical protein